VDLENAPRLAWFRSSRCESTHCVEMARDDDRIWLRNSSDANGVALDIDAAAWRRFLAYVAGREFAA
jgi:hypothetical protein